MEKCVKAMVAAGGSVFQGEVTALEAKIAAVRKERAEARPLSAQVRSLEFKLARKQKTAELAHGKLEEAQQAVLAAQEAVLAAEKHMGEAKTEVASLEEQHKDLFQHASREAGEEDSSRTPGQVPTFEQLIGGVPKELRDLPDLAEKIKQAEAIMAELRDKCPALDVAVCDVDPGPCGEACDAAQAAGDGAAGEPMAVDELVSRLLSAADGEMEGGDGQRTERVKELLESSFAAKRRKVVSRAAPYSS